MEIDSKVKIYLKDDFIVEEDCNYTAFISCLENDNEYLMSFKYIIPKENILFIEVIEGGAALSIK